MLNPRQIEAFRMVMLRGSVTGAAAAMHVSQPAVSRLIRDLEAKTELSLFERQGNSVVPTPEASLLLQEVERYAVGLQSLGNFARELAERRHGSVRVVAMPALAMGFLPDVLADFARGRPGLRISLHGMPSHLVVEAVTGGQAEIGFAITPGARAGLHIQPMEARLVVALPRDHRLAARRTVSAGDLTSERLIALAEPSIMATSSPRILTELFRDATFTTPLTGIACQLVSCGAGVAIVDPFSAQPFAAEGRILVRAFRPAIPIRTAIVTAENRPLSKLAAEVIESIRSAITAVTDGHRISG